LIERAYLLGFNASGEGYNSEYPFENSNVEPETDHSWTEQRDKNLKAMMEIV
jgi:hypothetical protein